MLIFDVSGMGHGSCMRIGRVGNLSKAAINHTSLIRLTHDPPAHRKTNFQYLPQY